MIKKTTSAMTATQEQGAPDGGAAALTKKHGGMLPTK